MGESNNTFDYTLNAKPPHVLGEVAFFSGSAGDLPPGSAGFDSRTSTSIVPRIVSLWVAPENVVHPSLAR